MSLSRVFKRPPPPKVLWNSLARAADVDSSLEEVSAAITTLLGAHIQSPAYALYRFDTAHGRYSLIYCGGAVGEEPDGTIEPRLNEMFVKRRRKAWLEAPEVISADEQLRSPCVYEERGMRILSVPLGSEQENVGLLQAFPYEPTGLTRGYASKLRDIGSVAGALLRAAMHRERDRTKLASLAASSMLGESLLESSFHIRSFVEKTLQVVVIATDSVGAAIKLDPRALQELGVREKDLGARQFVLGEVGEALAADPTRWQRLIDLTARTGTVSRTIETESTFGPHNLEHLLVAPVTVDDWSLGSLMLARSASAPYGAQDRRLAYMFSRQLGEVVQNAVAFEATERTYRNTLQMLVELMDGRTPETVGHSSRIRRWSLEIGREMGLDSDRLETLRWAALFHDVGMSGIGDEALATAGGLSAEQADRVSQHPHLGGIICDPLHLPHPISPAVRSHHERWDGRGYPDRLRADEIPLLGRVIAVAEAFNALTASRGYREPRSFSDAVDTIKAESGRAYDPEVVIAFEKATARAEIGSAPRCYEMKGTGADVCARCPAYRSPASCWAVPGVLCEQHGDRACETCFVYTRRAWLTRPDVESLTLTMLSTRPTDRLTSE